MAHKIAALSGDGIGPEVMTQALRVLEKVAPGAFEIQSGLVGGAAFDRYNTHFPEETRTLCERSDAILFGSVGGPLTESHLPKWKGCEANSILALRKAFEFHANFRPARVFQSLKNISPLKNEILSEGIDLLIVRELLGDLYFGSRTRETTRGARSATDTAEYTEQQIYAVAENAFEAARKRKTKLTSVDKANVLETSRLWREVVQEVSSRYPDVTLEHMLVDNCAMQIVKNPAHFDVILTSNMFGDILSDIAAVIPGSLGLTPSASFNRSGFGLYEPSGGSAPDIAGKNLANPIAQILSLALMLRYSFRMDTEAVRIEAAIETALNRGFRTHDIALQNELAIGCVEFTDSILDALS